MCKFRSYNYAIVSDIEKSFLQIRLAEKRRDCTRFIWIKNANNIDDKKFANNEFTELRFCRVLFGITSTPFLLNAAVRYYVLNYQEIQPEIL